MTLFVAQFIFKRNHRNVANSNFTLINSVEIWMIKIRNKKSILITDVIKSHKILFCDFYLVFSDSAELCNFYCGYREFFWWDFWESFWWRCTPTSKKIVDNFGKKIKIQPFNRALDTEKTTILLCIRKTIII
jgi:hypothetical protein